MSRFTDFVNWVKDTWQYLVQIAAVVIAIGIGILTPQPLLSSADPGLGDSLVNLSRLMAALLIGLLFVGVVRWKKRRHTTYWVALTLAAGIAICVLYFLRMSYYERHTVGYGHVRLVIGDTLTDDGRELWNGLPEDGYQQTNENLVFRACGDTSKLWPEEEISYNYHFLAILYLVTTLLVAVVIVSVTQCVRCSSG